MVSIVLVSGAPFSSLLLKSFS
ncbi:MULTISPECIES: hypothetical protein [Bacillus cereus group]